MPNRAVISGLGVVLAEPGVIPDASQLAMDAVAIACSDAGIGELDVDGLLINRNELLADDRLTLDFARRGPFGELRVLYELESKGTTMSVLVEQASRLIGEGRASNILVVFADAAMVPGKRTGSAFAGMGGDRGQRGLERANGMLGAVTAYALIARQYMQETGSNGDDLFAVANAQRDWATLNPLALARTRLTREDYQASPLVAAPLRRLDCARPVSGAVAILLSAGDSVQIGRTIPIEVRGSSQRYSMRRRHAPHSSWAPVGARDAFDDALEQGGCSRADLDMVQIYDPFSVVPLIMLEAVGLAEPGKAGAFIAEGNTSLGGALPVNTGGGQLSGFYLQGATPLVEAIQQLRGTAGKRQVLGAETAMVIAIGGRFEAQSSLLLGVVQ
jgi:acetyl-CoA acetyltransferase